MEDLFDVWEKMGELLQKPHPCIIEIREGIRFLVVNMARNYGCNSIMIGVDAQLRIDIEFPKIHKIREVYNVFNSREGAGFQTEQEEYDFLLDIYTELCSCALTRRGKINSTLRWWFRRFL